MNIVPMNAKSEASFFEVQRTLFSRNGFEIVQGLVGADKEQRLAVRGEGFKAYCVLPREFTDTLLNVLFMSDLTGINFPQLCNVIGDMPIMKYVPASARRS